MSVMNATRKNRLKYKMDTIDLEKEDISKIVYEVVNAKAASPENKGKRVPAVKKHKGKI